MDPRGSLISDEKHENRPILTIDLNEIPSPPSETPTHTPTAVPEDALSVVQSFHQNLQPAHGSPAEFPGEPGVGRSIPCGLCGRPESKSGTLVCDGCERGFHLSCIRLRHRQVAGIEDWVCGDCVRNGARSQRWPLGAVCTAPRRCGVRLLDINALPPSDIDGEESEEVHDFRPHASGVDTSNGISSTVQMPCSSLRCADNGFDLGNEQGTTTSAVKSGLEEMLAHQLTADGKRLFSMFDVARHMGTMPACSSIDIEDRSDGQAIVQKGLLIRRRRRKESARLSRINSFTENQENVRSSCDGDHSSDVEIIEPHSWNVRADGRVTEATKQEHGNSESHYLNIDLPVQYEDFFLLSLGEVDLRPSYHNMSQIWPVGYRSSWHDKITGSFFNCEVSDGGNYGPVFKVKRCPCSASSIPDGSTVLSHHNVAKDDDKMRVDGDNAVTAMACSDCDGDNDIQMILSDHCPPLLDVSSCLDSSLPGAFQAMDKLPVHCSSILKDELGEFSVEERSSSSSWTLVSHALIDACRKAYKHSGSLQFFCKHYADRTSSDSENTIAEDGADILARFRISSGPIGIPHVIQNDNDLEASCEALKKWLDQDRFGLDTEFVQEIIEQLPGARACSHYEFLEKRSHYSSSQTVGRGFLLAKRKRDQEDTSSGLSPMYKRSRREYLAQHQEMDEHFPLLGRPLSTRLPAELVGDVFQVWELLWRFYEILGLDEPLSFDELEQELIDPWFDGSNFLEKLEREIQEGRDVTVQRTDSSGCCAFSPTVESNSALPKENPPIFVQVETGSTKDAAQARVASQTYRRCTGVALTKAHTSLLKVLVGELQTKVAAFVDPNFDAGESKSRRGRKKEVDNSVPTKKSKIDMLPINELTWPELARRFILSVMAMDGNLDSSDVANRESGKVFRCLQGDGGILCGSLAGVAGMEADALLLAEAEKQVSDCVKREEFWPTDCKDNEVIGGYDSFMVNGSNIPEWAQPLEPVRKLPTNVGTRIRKCVFDALEKGPPDWAEKILKHSISKEVYKGNASGPTKKAVLAVLAEVCGENPQQKPVKGRREKSVGSMSDAIMKQCRIILRRSAASDDGKVFCNLLGTTLLSPNDNEDEGILGSPAMLSRPLDFRTIDLRLAVGAYGGCHEAFLEDVREVWHHISTAYGDRSDLMRLAETLSQNFESLYQKEVLSLVNKSAGDHDPESANRSAQKELGAPNSASQILKAPWEEGVCKVCGIDRDDDSVLLCDTCDSEYHTYCLNPPLARIPEGNWYCPSCVAGQSKAQDVPKYTFINRQRQRRYQGEGTRILSEALNQLVTRMEEKEYWELSIEERTFLLKFLCDEALSSAALREHLDQCADMSAELQQKLRSLSIECRELKFRELLTARNVRGPAGKFNGSGESAREVIPTIFVNNGRWTGHPQALSNMPNYYATIHGDLHQRMCTSVDGGQGENGPNDVNKHLGQFCLKNTLEKYFNGNNDIGNCFAPSNMKIEDAAAQTKTGPLADKSPLHANLLFPKTSGQDFSDIQFGQHISVPLQHRDGELASSAGCGDVQTKLPVTENNILGNLNGNHDPNVEKNVSLVPVLEVLQGSYHLPDIVRAQLVEHALPIPTGSTITMPSVDNLLLVRHDNMIPDVNDSQPACDAELSSLKNEISLVQNSIFSIESQIPKVSLRRDFLGRDSCGRLYWGLCRPGKHSFLAIDGSMPVQAKRRRMDGGGDSFADHLVGPIAKYSTLFSRDIYQQQLSNASSPTCSEFDGGAWSSCQWFLCESDLEIQELVSSLRISDPRERELKECILNWQRLRCEHNRDHVHNDTQDTVPKSSNSEKGAIPHCLSTNASTILERKYGSCLEPETNEIPKKRVRKGKASNEEKMYRCECLEPVWPSRYHCLSCHQTFSSSMDLEGHNDGRCGLGFQGPDESKENESTRDGKGIRCETTCERDHTDEAYAIGASKGGKLEFSSRLVKSQKKGGTCPYDLENISSKFVMKNSNKELVREIGLLGSNGNPSFVPSTPAYFHDPALMMIRQKSDEPDLTIGLATHENLPLVSTAQGMDDSVTYCHGGLIGGAEPSISNSSQRCVENSIDFETQKNEGCISECKNDKELVLPLNRTAVELEVGPSCTVPETSLRPIVGKVSQILRRLKINLLDMDAALPEDAVKTSKVHFSKRCAWRAFVKSAESIYEMVQAMIVFENMIKTEYLRNGWWYWSSLTAAAKVSTVSSLALRIYALDAAIMYQKTPSVSDPVDNPKAIKIGKKRKDAEKKDAEG